uniref:Chemokine interleukin-8-like domain-containing protein n=1 Tax=Papio anubis TaxID=9555 RepID=A0A8I5N6F3_PAPAN
MKPKMRFLWKIIALYSIVTVYAGFGDPRKARELIRKQYGQPCDCSGGQISEPPSDRITQVTCSGKTAYLMPNQLWKSQAPSCARENYQLTAQAQHDVRPEKPIPT